MRRIIVDDLQALLDTLPSHIVKPLHERGDLGELLEIVLDLGRLPEARFLGGEISLGSKETSEEDLSHVIERIGVFGGDNRAGIERTLHRISAIRNRSGRIIGITCRVGRAVYGTMRSVEDLADKDQSILLLGKPGVGKTTILREMARVLADDHNKRVIVVDTSNEIAGDGDIPHPGIGRARRMQVPMPSLQHQVMIEAVENHMPQVIIIDEMGTEQEAEAARTIAERGVQLIATAHGNTLENLVLNPTLSDLVGGVQTVILGDDEARRRRTQKTVQERKRPPTFDIVVEIRDREHVAVHLDVSNVVDEMLRGRIAQPEVRWVNDQGEIQTRTEVIHTTPIGYGYARPDNRRAKVTGVEEEHGSQAVDMPATVKLFSFGINRSSLQQAVRGTGVHVEIVDALDQTEVLVTTKAHYRRAPQIIKRAENRGILVHVIRKNTPSQVAQFVRGLFYGKGSHNPAATLEVALQEAQTAVERVWSGEDMVELSPQRSYIRRLQHQIADRYNLQSMSVGQEPVRRLTVYRLPSATL